MNSQSDNRESPAASERLVALGCLAALILFACLLHWEVLFGGAVYHMDDAADSYYPGHIAVARAFAHGELPTWERGSWCGWPMVVDPYNGIFYPLNVIYYAVGAARGVGYAVALHVVLGGAGMWLLLRRRRLSWGAALFGALAYELSTFGVVRIRHIIFVQMMGWLPWILVGVEGWMQSRRRRELALVAAATGLALVAGALSIGHFAALVVAGYTAARVLDREGGASGTGTGTALRDLGWLGGAAVLGALLAAAQIVPTLWHLPRSPRSLGSDYSFTSSYAWPSLSYVLTLLEPDLFGGEDRARYYGAPNHWELCGWYSGALAVLLAGAALLRPRPGPLGTRRRGAELWVLLGLVLLGVALALGDAGPVHKLFYRVVPLYASLRCPARALLMAVLAVPILGAHGVEALLERSPQDGQDGKKTVPAAGQRRLGAGFAGVLGALAVAVLVGAPKLPHLKLPGWTRTPALLRDLALGRSAAWFAAMQHLTLVLLAGAAVVVLLRSGIIRRQVAAALLALVLALDLLSVGRGYVALQQKPADYPAGMEDFAAVQWLRAHVAPEGAEQPERYVNDGDGPFRLHNSGLVFGLENASGYDSVAVWRYVEFLYLLNNGTRYPHKSLRDDFAGIGVHRLTSPLLDLMNVRWLIARDAPTGDRWREVFRPEALRPGEQPAPAAKYEATWNQLLRVYENTTVLPRAFVVHRSEVLDDARMAARLAAPSFDARKVALLEEDPGPAMGSAIGTGGDAAITPAKVVTAGRHELVLDVEDALPGVLVVGDVHYPGWSVTVDGEPAKLLRADWTFRGVALGPGRHRVVMRFTSRPTQVGIALSLLALLGIAALAWSGRRTG